MVKIDEIIDSLIRCGFLIINERYLKCLDKRFCNSYDIFDYFLFDKEEFFFVLNFMYIEVFLGENINLFYFFF